MGRNQAGLLRNVLGPDLTGHIHTVHDHVLQAVIIIFNADGQLIDVTVDSIDIFRGDAPQIQKICHGAVNGTGVHIVITQFLGQPLGNGALTGTGRAVDGDGISFSHSMIPLSYFHCCEAWPEPQLPGR